MHRCEKDCLRELQEGRNELRPALKDFRTKGKDEDNC